MSTAVTVTTTTAAPSACDYDTAGALLEMAKVAHQARVAPQVGTASTPQPPKHHHHAPAPAQAVPVGLGPTSTKMMSSLPPHQNLVSQPGFMGQAYPPHMAAAGLQLDAQAASYLHHLQYLHHWQSMQQQQPQPQQQQQPQPQQQQPSTTPAETMASKSSKPHKRDGRRAKRAPRAARGASKRSNRMATTATTTATTTTATVDAGTATASTAATAPMPDPCVEGVKPISNPSNSPGPSVSPAEPATPTQDVATSSATTSATPPTGSSSKANRRRKTQVPSHTAAEEAYRLKRARNNEAVRKCRIKKKQEMEERERLLKQYEQKVELLTARVRQLEQQLDQPRVCPHCGTSSICDAAQHSSPSSPASSGDGQSEQQA
ncbi:hypothetical protein PTSG_12078 [Salpingoeca rosetta]|uniref:BZIP domain-containing protein n=1 Tax=Salpingoeca rosetta (strain ATCC 50818 / BSB-021) TaxID=946362 RepID=F2U5B4_SALR5|nr:uncharacterized protein PTSG_12078 [Salpingoeca rosetta]EGD83130.1 hypothetical protein PTSG_12078 [Salpingoeca rosetta]|eukprot:XP_004995494.1 hypothetical protein PTSG_12078 [Salpingoeca rosetta]